MEITISDEQKELAKKAQEFSKKQQEANNDDSEVRHSVISNGPYILVLFPFATFMNDKLGIQEIQIVP